MQETGDAGASVSEVERRLVAYFSDTACDVSDEPFRVWLEGDSLAPFRVTPLRHVLAALQLASVGPSDVVCDVGCGDGRVVVAAAALCGARAVGIEIDPRVAALASTAVSAWNLQTRVVVSCADATQPGALDAATVVFASLLPDGVAVVAPALLTALDRGARVVTLYFPLPGGGEPAAVDEAHRLRLYHRARRQFE